MNSGAKQGQSCSPGRATSPLSTFLPNVGRRAGHGAQRGSWVLPPRELRPIVGPSYKIQSDSDTMATVPPNL